MLHSECQPNSNTSNAGTASKRVQRMYVVLVGHLTWWTTDQDLVQAMLSHSLQESDFGEIKFFENKLNGQSKGCVLYTLSNSIFSYIRLSILPVHLSSPALGICQMQTLIINANAYNFSYLDFPILVFYSHFSFNVSLFCNFFIFLHKNFTSIYMSYSSTYGLIYISTLGLLKS